MFVLGDSELVGTPSTVHFAQRVITVPLPIRQGAGHAPVHSDSDPCAWGSGDHARARRVVLNSSKEPEPLQTCTYHGR